MESSGEDRNGQPAVSWAALFGRWGFQGDRARYLQGTPWGSVEGQPIVGGLAVSNLRMQDGTVRVKLAFSEVRPGRDQGAGVVLGYASLHERYVFAQLGAGEAAYLLGEFTPGFGWRPLLAAGSKSNLHPNRDYNLEAVLVGQEIRLSVDGVPIFEHILQVPLSGSQLGLIAAGEVEVAFSDFIAAVQRPSVFVAMQFGEPFNTIYREVVRPECEKLKLPVVRIDEIPGPGIIFEDIKRHIAESKVVIAEITAPNQNVFYELGYAHALNKPTILMAQRGKELPFDIRSYRVIFYDDSIGGKPEVERNLHKHLLAVLHES